MAAARVEPDRMAADGTDPDRAAGADPDRTAPAGTGPDRSSARQPAAVPEPRADAPNPEQLEIADEAVSGRPEPQGGRTPRR